MSLEGQTSGRLPLIIGHRGACAFAPENTLASFEVAFRGGADGVEFDVRLASDGVPVVIHDPTLTRTAQVPGAVESHDSAFLTRLNAGAWFNEQRPELAFEEFAGEHVPTLAQVFERYAGRHLYVEMKCEEPARRAGLARAVVELVREHGIEGRVVVKSFEHDSLKEVKRLAPLIRTAALFDRSRQRPLVPAAKIIAEAVDCGADEISLHLSLLRKATVESARARGFEVVVWTVNSPFWLRRAVALNLRAVITDDPRRLRQELLRKFHPILGVRR